ncbi:MAG: cofactor-independent phosphoglycerate mutase [Planctomycetes bacterium]|nr:cofactor-independent phosphoglycerate mutase [Planctomycetota bacterium]NOG55728.1 cofactor-independent phosphoglycerate mutase [Planctomycetota bacterium]
MKYVLILPDGAADDPLPSLDGKTPLAAAATPNMDLVAAHGVQGLAQTVPAGFIPGTDVATLSLFSYDPAGYYTGRAPLEAAAQGLTAASDELIFRCNFVTIDDNGCLADFTADHITQPHADRLIADLNTVFADAGCVFHAGVSYRNLMMAQEAARFEGLVCQAPHDIPGLAVADYPPHGCCQPGLDWLKMLMQRAADDVLADHPVNTERIANGQGPATNIWLWGQGRPTVLEPFADRFNGVRGVVITGVDIIRGIARCMGMELIEVPGATGYLDTDYAAKGAAGVRALDDYDMVVVHIEAPDEAGHEGNAAAKVKAIEEVDCHIVGPMLEAVQQFKEWRIMVAPDHPTPCTTKAHSSVPPPFCYTGSDILADTAQHSGLPFCEQSAQQTGVMVDPGSALMGRFIVGQDEYHES